MTTTSSHDAWTAGESYDVYMGRWSRPVAARFLEWLEMPAGLAWLDLGCGTGALSAAIITRCEPAKVLGVDPSEGFVAQARVNVPDSRAEFRVGSDIAALPPCDVAVSALVLNFVPDPVGALRDLGKIVGNGGTVAFYVWDYPGGGLEFVRWFWEAARALDPAAADLDEARRFAMCTRDELLGLAHRAGLVAPVVTAIESRSVFADFEDYWRPFTLGAGPAPGYCASLSEEARLRLKDRLGDILPRQPDGSISLGTRAWAVRMRAG